MRAFSFRLTGSFHSGPLYDQAGREVFSLAQAIAVVEDIYSDEWEKVFNGDEGISRPEWLESKATSGV